MCIQYTLYGLKKFSQEIFSGIFNFWIERGVTILTEDFAFLLMIDRLIGCLAYKIRLREGQGEKPWKLYRVITAGSQKSAESVTCRLH
jgi:hypothetical protein